MKELVNLVSALSLWCVLLLVILPILPILCVVVLLRQIEAHIYRCFYNATAFNSQDILWMLDSEKNRFIINGVMILKGEINMDALKRKIYLSLTDIKNKELYSRATQHIVSGYINYYWVKDEGEFDIDDHVYKPFDILIKGEKGIQEFISKQCNKAFNGRIKSDTCKKSPWEIIIIPFLHGDTVKTALHIRLSHAIADGSALAYYLLYRLADDGKLCRHESVQKFSEKQRGLLLFTGALFLPLRYARLMLEQSDNHCLHSDEITGVKHVTWSDSMDLKIVKAAKNRFNVTVADVLLGCLSVSLNRYFRRYNMESPNEFLVLIPVDIRSSSEHAKSFDNQVATIPLKLPTGISSISKAIEEVNKRTRSFKGSGEPFSNYLGWKVGSYFLPQRIAKAFIYHFVNKSSAIASILNASHEPVSITEHDVEYIAFWPPQTGNEGLGISFCSYSGTIRLGLEVDSALMEYPSELVISFHRVYKDLQQCFQLES